MTTINAALIVQNLLLDSSVNSPENDVFAKPTSGEKERTAYRIGDADADRVIAEIKKLGKKETQGYVLGELHARAASHPSNTVGIMFTPAAAEKLNNYASTLGTTMLFSAEKSVATSVEKQTHSKGVKPSSFKITKSDLELELTKRSQSTCPVRSSVKEIGVGDDGNVYARVENWWEVGQFGGQWAGDTVYLRYDRNGRFEYTQYADLGPLEKKLKDGSHVRITRNGDDYDVSFSGRLPK